MPVTDGRTDRQTDGQTDMPTTYSPGPPPGAGVAPLRRRRAGAGTTTTTTTPPVGQNITTRRARRNQCFIAFCKGKWPFPTFCRVNRVPIDIIDQDFVSFI